MTVRPREVILLVEDEPVVRRMVLRTLRHLGYDVLEAENGLDAMRVWDESDGAVDLLLTDMVMPDGPSGIELGAQLRRRKPSLEVIIMSGYSDKLLNGGPLETADVRFVSKPFSITTLGEAVAEALHGSAERGADPKN